MDTLAQVATFSDTSAVPPTMEKFAQEGLRRAKKIDCFEFVPSNHAVLHACLEKMRPTRFCEWGSGIGIGVGVANMLGFEAEGIEINSDLVRASQQLFRDFNIAGTVQQGSFFNIDVQAEVYFAYGWARQVESVKTRFAECAPQDSILLLCHGASEIRQYVKAS